jgi:outer membrane lipoprotein-sorting protein
MKNLFIFIAFIIAFVLVFVQTSSAQSVDDIINNYITARGGIDKLHAITSISLEGTREMMGNEVQVKVTKVQGKLFRTDFEFGGNTGYTIITPDKGWSYIPMRSDKADPIPADRLKLMQSEMDIAGPLVDYKSKGYQAALLGKETINGKECYKIQLTAADGNTSLYYIDTKTNLLLQTRHKAEAAGRNGGKEPQEVITNFSDYKDFGGVLFPQTLGNEGAGMNAGSMTFDKIEVNMPVDEKLYKPGK